MEKMAHGILRLASSTALESTSGLPSARKCNGLMGVPITFFDRHAIDQFLIVGMDLNDSVQELGIQPIGEEWIKKYRKQGGKGHITANMHSLVYTSSDGKAISIYRRILIRRKDQ